MIVPQDLSGDDSRASYGTPHVSLLGASPTGWSNDKLALAVERSPLEKDRHGRRPITTVSASTAITYPRPQRFRRSSLKERGRVKASATSDLGCLRSRRTR
jgi:hypothetical protein